jgi:hypothetical protein
MRKYNKKLNEDITELKELHGKRDKSDFNRRKAEIMKSHGISKATVYREMKKDVPGFYKTPRYWPPVKPVTEKHKEMVRAMYQKQMNGEQVRAEMERQTGESWPWERLQKIRESNDADDLLKKGDTKKSRKRKKTLLPVESDAPKIETSVCKLEPDPVDWNYESPNGQDMKIFFEALLNADKMDRNSCLLLRFKGMEAMFGREELNIMQLYAASSAACKGRNTALFSKMVGIQLCYQQLRMFAAGAVHTPKDISICLETITKNSEKTFTETPDFNLLVKVVKHFCPEANELEIKVITLQFADELKGCSEEIKPDINELRRLAAKEADENI